MSGCVYSGNDRAADLADATPTTSRTPVPATPAADVTPEEGTTPTTDDPDAEPTATTPQSEPGWVVVENVDIGLNVRSGPGTSNGVVAEAPLGATLRTTGNEERVDESIWVEVEFEGTTGWVHSGFVAPTEKPTPTPLPTPTAVAGPDDLVVDAPGGVPLRAEPRINAEQLRILENDAVVTPTGREETDGGGREWVEVRDREGRGWARADGFRRP